MNLHSHNWNQIITELEARGITNSEVANQLKVTRSAVFKWKACDVEPSHYLGERLLTLHKKHCVLPKVDNISAENVV